MAEEYELLESLAPRLGRLLPVQISFREALTSRQRSPYRRWLAPSHHNVISSVAIATHTDNQAVMGQQITMGFAVVLAATFRMHDQG